MTSPAAGRASSDEVLAVRRAVRGALEDVPADRAVLVACSGGPDSLALAGTCGYLARRDARRIGAVTVDHGLQPGSAERAREVAAVLVRLGLDPVEVVHVRVPRGARGPEGEARHARYAVLDAAAARYDAAAVLLGHTRDDQAETVLLGLARGSGARSLSGMAPVTHRYRRPLLALPRATVRAAVPTGLVPWEDPHNLDPAYARARIRHRALPALEEAVGPGVTEALARTADLLRADADALDEWAGRAFNECLIIADLGGPALRERGEDRELDVGKLGDLPRAVRFRVIRRAALAAGSPATDLTAAHVRAVDDLLTRWRGQRGVDLPGKVRARRRGSVLHLGAARPG